MARKVLLAALWAGSLVAVGAVSSKASQAPKPAAAPIDFHADRVASVNGFTLVKANSSIYNQECFLMYEGPKGVAMAPAKCP